jgi:hypothetical protein
MEFTVTTMAFIPFFMYLWPTYYALEIRVYIPTYSNSHSILGCFTDSVRFLDFFLRDIIFSGMLYFHNIPLNIISSGML